MDHLSASYQLVYFQPDPEDGERVCVALLFVADRDVDLLYDSDFRRLRCLNPGIDPSLVQFYLEDLASSLKQRGRDLDALLLEQSPHLVTSPKRRVTWPLTNQLRLQLIERFLNKGARELEAPQVLEARAPKVDVVQENLRKLLTERARISTERLQEKAKPEFVLGRRMPQIKPVAFAVLRGDGVTLIDGVDLNTLTAPKAVARIGKVAYTFFQYRREQQFITFKPIRKIGVVMNGASFNTPDKRDAHDFALKEFQAEADLTVDTSQPEQVQQLKNELAAN